MGTWPKILPKQQRFLTRQIRKMKAKNILPQKNEKSKS
jgi:hypothetical protein